MSETKAPSNFIRQIIDRDLAEGKNDGQVVTRFPPEPNGYLHIGHAKSICLNFGIAESYQGACNLRFDDTNPEKEEDEYIQSIQRDVEWLGFEWSGEVRFASNYFDRLYELAVELIEKGLAYVDSLSPEQIAEYRGNFTTPGKESPYRERSVEENLALFEKMRANEMDEGEAVLRAKIDMQSPNINLRDPILYRIRKKVHHQTGDKWVIYPMYDFTHPLSDAIEGALVRGPNGQAYLLGDANLTYADYLGAFFVAAGDREPLELVDAPHPLIPDSAMLRGRGETIHYTIDEEGRRTLGYRVDDVLPTIELIVRNERERGCAA